jgi:dTMP kinase
MSKHGIYIALEGLDGCGKSTQAKRLAEHLDAVLTREPGGTPVGGHIRAVVLNGTDPIDARAEALLFAADRAQHVADVIKPALDQGRHVVSDRSVWSSAVYQGVGRGLGVDDIISINQWATSGVLPDIVIYIDTPFFEHDNGSDRDRMEREKDTFHDDVRKGFRNLAAEHGWIRIDGNGTIDEVADTIATALAHIPRHKENPQ